MLPGFSFCARDVLADVRRPSRRALASAGLAALCGSLAVSAQSFDYAVIDSVGPVTPWAKAVGDINQDGLTDVIVGGHTHRVYSLTERIGNKLGWFDASAELGELVWYAAPDWQRHTVSTRFAIRTDVETGDLDGDGDADIVAVTDQGLVWFAAPEWTATTVDPNKWHDVELADINDDGRLDMVLRNQSLFGYENGNAVLVLTQNPDGSWDRDTLTTPHGEGLLVHDLDRDGLPEIIVNDLYFVRQANRWRSTRYTPTDWDWQNVFIAAGDVDGDGRDDLVLSPAELESERYRLSWFRAPAEASGPWQEQIVDGDTEAVHHSVLAADFDRDGQVDIATARMTQGADPDEVAIYRNLGEGRRFEKEILATTGSHSMRLLDVDGDFDLDLIGANWQKDDYDGAYPVELWRNRSGDKMPERWQRHVIDDDRQGQALFIRAADLNADGHTDLMTGGYWYLNSGRLGGNWPRRLLGDGAHNALLVADLDGNEWPDVIASGWRGYNVKPSVTQRLLSKLGWREDFYGPPGNQLTALLNPGSKARAVFTDIAPASGDFAQGVALRNTADGQQVVIAFHAPETSLQALQMPGDAIGGRWLHRQLHPSSQNEQLSAIDLDGDGREDLVTGTRWLDADGALHPIATHDRVPDRHVVADINGDGVLDIVVGDEAVSRAGQVVWYDRGDDPRQPWTEHSVLTLIGPMSLDAGDVDGDGDVDLMVGEHNLTAPANARLVFVENLDGRGLQWRAHLVYRGDEHHDGAQLVDLDRDGDLDVMSIGWQHGGVLVYENRMTGEPE